MKTIKLKDGIPSISIQNLNESMYNIIEGIDNHNISLISKIIDEDDEIEETENKLIAKFYQAFKGTLVQNGYSDLLTEHEMIEYVSSYVKLYVVN